MLATHGKDTKRPTFNSIAGDSPPSKTKNSQHRRHDHVLGSVPEKLLLLRGDFSQDRGQTGLPRATVHARMSDQFVCVARDPERCDARVLP